MRELIEDDLPMLHDNNPDVPVWQGVKCMRYDKDRNPCIGYLAEESADLFPSDHVKVAEGFIEEKNLWILC